MTGTKTNERPGVRAQVKYVRTSAYKAREILDLIRGEQVGKALEILEFTERDIARVILKCLESAVANAAANHNLPDADELYVSACYADEGPTLKRFRPRARGRASRIRKRTCHITIIVSRLEDDRLAIIRTAESTSGAAKGTARAAAEARRERVAASRASKAERKAAEEAAEHEGHDHDAAAIAVEAEAEGIVDVDAAGVAQAEAAEAETADMPTDAAADDSAADAPADEADEEEKDA